MESELLLFCHQRIWVVVVFVAGKEGVVVVVVAHDVVVPSFGLLVVLDLRRLWRRRRRDGPTHCRPSRCTWSLTFSLGSFRGYFLPWVGFFVCGWDVGWDERLVFRFCPCRRSWLLTQTPPGQSWGLFFSRASHRCLVIHVRCRHVIEE